MIRLKDHLYLIESTEEWDQIESLAQEIILDDLSFVSNLEVLDGYVSAVTFCDGTFSCCAFESYSFSGESDSALDEIKGEDGDFTDECFNQLLRETITESQPLYPHERIANCELCNPFDFPWAPFNHIDPEYLKGAIKDIGSISAFARLVGVSRESVYKWIGSKSEPGVGVNGLTARAILHLFQNQKNWEGQRLTRI